MNVLASSVLRCTEAAGAVSHQTTAWTKYSGQRRSCSPGIEHPAPKGLESDAGTSVLRGVCVDGNRGCYNIHQYTITLYNIL